jgi:hypothetical protein
MKKGKKRGKKKKEKRNRLYSTLSAAMSNLYQKTEDSILALQNVRLVNICHII